jgi:hypothetical protein
MLWEAFMPELLTFAPGCPIPLAESKVRQAAIEFFRRTRAWVEWLDPVTTLASASTDYPMVNASGADVARIEQATLDGRPLGVVSYPGADKDVSELGLISHDLKTFRLGGIVAAGLLVQVQAALIPSRTSTVIPDALFEKYADSIAHGARAKILSIPNTAFYNPGVYALERSEFEAAIATKSVESWRGLTKNTPRGRVIFC